MSTTPQHTVGEYSVRWAHRYYDKGEARYLDFTTRHYAKNDVTGCGHRVPPAGEVISREVRSVAETNCRRCLRRRDVREALKARM